jgi:hypothetical protein
MLTPASLPPGERQLYSLLRQILDHPGVLRGNLVSSRPECGKPSCHCHRGRQKGHPSLYLGLSLKGKRRMIYIPPDWEPQVRDWVDRYAQVRELLEQLSLACLKRLESRKAPP